MQLQLVPTRQNGSAGDRCCARLGPVLKDGSRLGADAGRRSVVVDEGAGLRAGSKLQAIRVVMVADKS